jgi:hypothetical protein
MYLKNFSEYPLSFNTSLVQNFSQLSLSLLDINNSVTSLHYMTIHCSILVDEFKWMKHIFQPITSLTKLTSFETV